MKDRWISCNEPSYMYISPYHSSSILGIVVLRENFIKMFLTGKAIYLDSQTRRWIKDWHCCLWWYRLVGINYCQAEGTIDVYCSRTIDVYCYRSRTIDIYCSLSQTSWPEGVFSVNYIWYKPHHFLVNKPSCSL